MEKLPLARRTGLLFFRATIISVLILFAVIGTLAFRTSTPKKLIPGPTYSGNLYRLGQTDFFSDDQLYVLYMTNTQLKDLLSHEEGNTKKLVFQFFHQADGKLTLLAWAGKKKNKKFFTRYIIQLSVSGIMQKNLSSQNIMIGNQQIKDKPLLKKLRTIADLPDTWYIEFKPELDASKTPNVVFYNIDTVKTLSKGPGPLPLLSFGSTNPSPPYEGN